MANIIIAGSSKLYKEMIKLKQELELDGNNVINYPKECIKNNTKVSVDECRKIINDLNDIIESKESRS